MISGLLKIFVVGFAYLVINYAEIFENHDYYYAICSVAYSSCALISAICAIKIQSKSLLYYSTLCVLFAILNSAIMLNQDVFFLIEGIYWDYTINFCLILESFEYVIIGEGCINVIYSIYRDAGTDSDNDSNFDARVGLH